MGEGTEISIGSLSNLRVAGDLGAATVLTGRDELHDRQVMVVLFGHDEGDRIEQFRDRYRAVTLISRIASPYTAGHSDDGRQYFVLPSSEDLVLADDVDADLATAHPTTRPSPQQLQDFFASLCRVVAEMHDRDCPHGFLDPKLICRTRAWKLASVGGVELQVFGDRAIAGAQLDPGYCAPEHSEAAATVSGDIYSLGMILRDLGDLGGYDLDEVIARATAPHPADRHVSTHELLADAIDSLEHQPSQPTPASDHTPAPPTRQMPVFVPDDPVEPAAADQPAADPAAVEYAAVDPVAVADAPIAPASPGRPSRVAPVVMSLVAGIAIGAIAIGGYVLVTGTDDSPTSTSTTVETADDVAPTATEVLAATTVPAVATVTPATPVPATPTPAPTTEPSTPAATAPSTRTATLYADPANLRSEANVNSPQVASLIGARGSNLEVLSPITNGWYEVDHADGSGWLFGAFVVPPDDGYLVVEHVDGLGESISLLSESGIEISTTNPTSNLALVSDTTTELWEVLLPDGRAAWIDPSQVEPR